jgi:hypothetical protein
MHLSAFTYSQNTCMQQSPYTKIYNYALRLSDNCGNQDFPEVFWLPVAILAIHFATFFVPI